ncbi:MAG: DNA polymerase III subunit beta, partial [Firmicutes bacterium]|nr:DNA polymerase III subunit beta [Bacillota bacterium]
VEVLSNVSRSVSVRSTIPVLEGIHVTVKSGYVEFESFNMEFGVRTSIKASSTEDGSIVIPAKIFTEVAKKMPDGLITISTKELNVEIVSLNCQFVIPALDSDEFPNFPKMSTEKSIELPSDIIKSMIQQTIFAVAGEDDSKNIHRGILLEIKEKELTLVAVDGFRLAIRRENVSISDNFKIIIPGKALSEILRLLPEDLDIKIYLNKKYIFLEFKNYNFFSLLLEGKFINYESVIPKKCTTKIKTKTEDAITSLERISVIIKNRPQSPVKATIGSKDVRISCSTSLGCSNNTFYAKIEGEPLEIAFNDKFMLDALKNVESDEIIIEMTSALNPIKLVPIEGDSFLFIVLPVKLREE